MTEINVKVCGSQVRPGAIESINHQAGKYIDSPFSGLKDVSISSVEETTCVFNTPGFPSACL